MTDDPPMMACTLMATVTETCIMIVFLVIFSPGRAILSTQGIHWRKIVLTWLDIIIVIIVIVIFSCDHHHHRWLVDS